MLFTAGAGSRGVIAQRGAESAAGGAALLCRPIYIHHTSRPFPHLPFLSVYLEEVPTGPVQGRRPGEGHWRRQQQPGGGAGEGRGPHGAGPHGGGLQPVQLHGT